VVITIAILKYFDTIRMLLRKGTTDDPYVLMTEEISIINNKASLNEVPDSFYHVIIDGYTEIYKDYFDEVKKIESDQFFVDYQTGMLYFSKSENGKTLTAEYRGRGVVQYPAERIWLHSPNPWVVDNLQEFVDLIYEKIRQILELFQNYSDKVTSLFKEYSDKAEEKYNDFVAYINTYIVKADKKIDEMDVEILRSQVATEEAQVATISAKNATIECIEVTKDLEEIKDAAVTATNNAIEATEDAIDATKDAIAETQAMLVDRYNTRYIYKEPVETFSDIAVQYPNPDVGWRVMTKNNGNVYRWSGIGWTYVENLTGGVPLATLTEDGLMSSEMFKKLLGIQEEAEKNYRGEDAKLALPNYFRYRTFVFVLTGELFAGVQNVILQCPSTGIIRNVTAFCKEAGADNTFIQIDKINTDDFKNNVDAWSPILYPDSMILFEYAKKVAPSPSISQQNIIKNDYLRVRIIQLGAGIQDITIQVDIEI